MKKYALLLVGLLALPAYAHGNGLGWFLGGAVVGGLMEHERHEHRPRVEYHYHDRYAPPQPVVVYQTPAPAPVTPVYVSPDGYEFCPPGYFLVRKVNQYGYADNVGCSR